MLPFRRPVVLYAALFVLLPFCLIVIALAACVRFGPQTERHSQCLICQRERDELVVCGHKIRDRVISNEYSDWIDSFTPQHSHAWLAASITHREHWFGSQSIGCGGIAALPTIYRSRAALGEQNARKLVQLFQAEVKRGYQGQANYKRLQQFANQVERNPQALLAAGSQ